MSTFPLDDVQYKINILSKQHLGSNLDTWLQHLKTCLIFLNNPRILKRQIKGFENNIDNLIQQKSHPLELIETTAKLFLSIILSVFDTTAKSFNEIFTKSKEAILSNNPDTEPSLASPLFNINKLLVECLFIKIQKTLDGDFDDIRLIDYLLEIYTHFNINQKLFILNVTKILLDPFRVALNIKERVKKLLNSIFGNSKNFEFYQMSNFQLSKILTEQENESVGNLEAELTLYHGNELIKKWNIHQFGLDDPEFNLYRHDKIITIGSSEVADIRIDLPNIDAIKYIMYNTPNGYKIFDYSFNKDARFFLPYYTGILLKEGSKFLFDNILIQFLDLTLIDIKLVIQYKDIDLIAEKDYFINKLGDGVSEISIYNSFDSTEPITESKLYITCLEGLFYIFYLEERSQLYHYYSNYYNLEDTIHSSYLITSDLLSISKADYSLSSYNPSEVYIPINDHFLIYTVKSSTPLSNIITN